MSRRISGSFVEKRVGTQSVYNGLCKYQAAEALRAILNRRHGPVRAAAWETVAK
jgi:hypothetical protein